MMKTKFSELIRGQIILTEVVELQAHHSLIVSYRGDLLRVTNTTGNVFTVGEKIRLQVISTNPLEFRTPTQTLDRII